MSKKNVKMKNVVAVTAESTWTKKEGYRSNLIFHKEGKKICILLTRNQLVSIKDMLNEILFEMAKHEAGSEGFVIITDDLDNMPRNGKRRCYKKSRP